MTTYHHGNLREALLARAVEVIGEQGVEGLSLRMVAKDLGVSHAAPKRHFASKADLLAAIVRESYQALTQAIWAEAEKISVEEPVKRLNVMARETLRWALQNKARFSVMTNPDVSRYADADLKAALETFAGLVTMAIEAAQAKGFKKGISVHIILYSAVGAALGVATMATDSLMSAVLGSPEEEETLTQIANQIIPLDIPVK